MEEPVDKVIRQFVLWLPVVSSRLAVCRFTAGNNFARQMRGKIGRPGRPGKAGRGAEIEGDYVSRPRYS